MATVISIGQASAQALHVDACDLIVTLELSFTPQAAQVVHAALPGSRALLDNGTGEPWPGRVVSADNVHYVIEVQLDA